MAMPAFDTHKAVKELCSAGFDDAQAEAVVDQIHGAVNENVATKADIERLATKEELRDAIANLATKEELKQAFEKIELRLEAELEKLTTKCLRYVGLAAAVVVGLTKALDLLLV